MANSSNINKCIKELMKVIPEGMVPESYLEYLFLEEEDVSENKDELMGNVKMQLADETGMEIPLTRKEAEEYLYDSINDMMWQELSQDSMISSRQVKMIEDYDEKSVLEFIKEMPLIPASKVISSIISTYMNAHGLEVTAEREAEIMEDMIHMLGAPFSDVFMEDDDDDEDDDDFEDELNLEFEDGFNMDEEWSEDSKESSERTDAPDQAPRKNRRSRITRFPGKK